MNFTNQNKDVNFNERHFDLQSFRKHQSVLTNKHLETVTQNTGCISDNEGGTMHIPNVTAEQT